MSAPDSSTRAQAVVGVGLVVGHRVRKVRHRLLDGRLVALERLAEACERLVLEGLGAPGGGLEALREPLGERIEGLRRTGLPLALALHGLGLETREVGGEVLHPRLGLGHRVAQGAGPRRGRSDHRLARLLERRAVLAADSEATAARRASSRSICAAVSPRRLPAASRNAASLAHVLEVLVDPSRHGVELAQRRVVLRELAADRLDVARPGGEGFLHGPGALQDLGAVLQAARELGGDRAHLGGALLDERRELLRQHVALPLELVDVGTVAAVGDAEGDEDQQDDGERDDIAERQEHVPLPHGSPSVARGRSGCQRDGEPGAEGASLSA